MFFIGVFGIETKQEPVTIQNSVICSNCEALGRYEIFKSYSYFHFFFLPIYKWNKRYLLKTSCCNRLYTLSPEIGEKLEKGQSVEITKKDLSPIAYYEGSTFCPQCQAEVHPSHRFCPHCGTRIK